MENVGGKPQVRNGLDISNLGSYFLRFFLESLMVVYHLRASALIATTDAVVAAIIWAISLNALTSSLKLYLDYSALGRYVSSALCG